MSGASEQHWGPPRASADRIPLWFEEKVTVPAEFRDLLVEYSHVPHEEANEHVIRVVSAHFSSHFHQMADLIPSAIEPGRFTHTHAWVNSDSWNLTSQIDLETFMLGF